MSPIPPVRLFGQEIWLGWLMIAALAYSVIPPVILGRMKLPLARRLQDEVLHTDALMQKADWMTGLAGIAGIIGIGLGYWWADAVAAGIISFSILHDGVTSLRIAVAELADGAPRELGSARIEEEAEALEKRLQALYPRRRRAASGFGPLHPRGGWRGGLARLRRPRLDLARPAGPQLAPRSAQLRSARREGRGVGDRRRNLARDTEGPGRRRRGRSG